jgi:predicted Rossmann fold nucleotide-binding protein DprA/Smf involved in DNA uptake
MHNARKQMRTDQQKILEALREKPMKVFEIMKRTNIKNQEDCQSLLLKMRDDGAIKFDIHKGVWLTG